MRLAKPVGEHERGILVLPASSTHGSFSLLTAGASALRRQWGLLLILTWAVFAGGCVSPTRPVSPGGTGSIHVAAPLSALEAEAFSGAKMRLSQGNLRRELLLEVTGEVIAGEVDNLPIGDWLVDLEIYDLEGDITHTATGAVRVRPGETATLRLEAQPNDGILEILAQVHGFVEAHSVQRARINFHNNQTATLDRDDHDPMLFHGTKPLRPGDYDYRIELYGATQYAADRLYQSPWESVRIHPGKTVRVTWQAASGSAHIEMGMSRMPSPPGALEVEAGAGGLRLLWQAPADTDVTAYRIYLKQDEYSAFSLKQEVPALERSWLVPEKDVKNGAWLTVTAVTSDGRESFRSNVMYIPGGGD